MTEYTADAQLTGISLAYTNPEYIADKIFKRVPVSTESFKYKKYDKSLNLQLPDSSVGETSLPNEVKFKHDKVTASVRSDALIDYISQTAVEEAGAESENLFTTSTEFLTDVFYACREKRLADLLQDANNYNGNAKTLATSEKFTATGVNAFNVIDEAMDKVWFKPNVMVGSRGAINALRRNPYVVKAANRNSGDAGKATLADLKDLFELQDIFVGNSVVNTSKRGQTDNFVNTWGNAIMLLYIAPQATITHGLTFGFTAEKGKRAVTKAFDSERGVRGVHCIKVAEQKADVIIAPECGYLISNVY